MTTHEVEEMLSITKKTLIYYENEGLVKPSRDSNNYRNYAQEDISKIKFILLLREMDVTIEEIKQIINDKKSIRDVLENKKDMIKKQHLDLENIDERINNYIKRRKVKRAWGRMSRDITKDIYGDLNYAPITLFGNKLNVGIIGAGRGALIKTKNFSFFFAIILSLLFFVKAFTTSS